MFTSWLRSSFSPRVFEPSRCTHTFRNCKAFFSDAKAPSSNLRAIRDEFTRQASVFESTWADRNKKGKWETLDWIMGHIAPTLPRAATALDVACGTGILTRHLASHCKFVDGVDATQAMLDQALNSSMNEKITNIGFSWSDAANLPYQSDYFDLVTCRLAIHHFSEPADQVREMARVCKPGGHVVLIDLVSVDDADTAAEHNRLEILRDPSHTRAVSAGELAQLLTDCGLKLTHDLDDGEGLPMFQNPLNVEEWMNTTNTPPWARIKIERSIEIELGGGTPTGMHAYRDTEGQACFVHTWAIAKAVKL